MSTTIKSLKTKIKVTFFISEKAAQGAKEIYLWCEHNNWEKIPLVMSTAKSKEGSFSTSIDLDKNGLKDRYEYRFQYIMEDGSSKFDNDWDADGYCPSPLGNDNSYFNTAVPEEEAVVETEVTPVKEVKSATKTTKTAAKTAKSTTKAASTSKAATKTSTAKSPVKTATKTASKTTAKKTK